MNDTNAIETVAAKRLISYTRKKPKASDSAEGIARWWLKMPLEEVLPALEALVKQGMWEKLKRNDHVIYRPINKSNP